MRGIYHSIIALIFAHILVIVKTNFSFTSYTISPNYAKSTASVYNITFTATSTVTDNFNLRILFPSQFSPTSPTNCAFKLINTFVSGVACSVDTITNQIIFSNLNIATTVTSYSVQFTTSTARYSGASTLTFSYYNLNGTKSTTIFDTPVSVSLSNAVMACGITSSNGIVGANTSYTVSYTPLVQIQKDSIFQIQIDPWSSYKLSNFLNGSTTADICAGNCSISIPSSNSNLFQIVRYTSLFSTAAVASGTNTNVILSRVRNPASTYPIAISLILSARINSTYSITYQNCSTTFAVATPNVFPTVNFAASNTAINAQNIITLLLQFTNPIFTNSYLRFQTSLSLSYQFAAYISGVSGVVPQNYSAPSGQLLIGNLTTSSPSSSPGTIRLSNFTLKNPQYANEAVTVTITTQSLVSSVYYLLDRSTVLITAVPSIISSKNITVVNTGINLLGNYTISFTNVNPIPSGGFIFIVLPSVLSTTGSSCSISGFSGSCSIFNSSVYKTQITSNITSGTALTTTLTNVKNPATTTTTPSLKIYTYHSTQARLIDYSDSGLTITATQVPLNSVVLASTSLVVGANSNYTIDIQTTNTLPSGSWLTILIPTSSFSASTIAMNSFKINGNTISGCTMQIISSMYFNFSSCINSDVLNSQTISIVLSNITNPSSTKTSNSWEVKTFYQNKLMQYLTSGITITMTVPAALSSSKITPENSTVNMQTTYTFDLSFLFLHYTNDRILINFPDGVSYGTKMNCTAVTSGISLACFDNSVTQIQVRITYQTTTYDKKITFNVSSIINNWYASTRTFNILTTTNDTSYYYVQSGSNTINFSPATVTTIVANNNGIILTGISTISLLLTSPFSFPSGITKSDINMIVTVPSSLTPINQTCTLSYASAVCILASTQAYTLTLIDDFSSSLNMSFQAQTSYFTETSPFNITLKYGSNTIATNLIATVKPYCTNPCKQCSTSQTACVSCLQSPNTQNITFFPDNATCVQTCPSTYYLSGAQCSKCSSTLCLNCVGTASNCTSCQTSKNLYNNTCVSVCPSGYYANNQQCLLCLSPCANCTSSTVCLSCITNYYLDTDSKCRIVCSNSSYLGVDGICMLCTNNCSSCSGTLSNCTSCDDTQFVLFNNTCQRACAQGYYNYKDINYTCELCKSPCATCISASSCLTCVANYYIYNTYTCTSSCPPGTLAVVDTCQSCTNNCATCSNTLSNCTSCSGIYLFYQFDCITQCPLLTYPYNKTCTNCISPCVTCKSDPNLCQSCIEGKLLLNTSCVDICPPTGYYLVSNSCLICPANCLTCNSSVSCVLCSDSYFLLDGSCEKTCPDSYPIISNRVCTACQIQCATCEGSVDNCTSCKLFFYKYRYSCVPSCPILTYSNQANYQCQIGFNSKIAYFPILIIMVVAFLIILISKCIMPATALITVLAALYSILQLAIWLYFFAMIFQSISQPDIIYALPIALTVITIVLLVISNIAFFYFNSKKLTEDKYVIQWCVNNVNWWTLQVFRYLALIFMNKFFRLVYSRIFKIKPLSLVYHNHSNVFPLAIIFALICMFFCQLPMLAASFYLAYNKLLKDQLFYTSVQCLIVTLIATAFAIIDIYKSEDFFDDTPFMQDKKYIEKVNDDSRNQIDQDFGIHKDQGQLDAEQFQGTSGGKFKYSKRDPSSLNQLFFEEKSIVTDVNQNTVAKKGNRINIFDEIKEDQQYLYDQQKYSNEDYQTQLQLEKQGRRLTTVKSENESDSEDEVGNMKKSKKQKLDTKGKGGGRDKLKIKHRRSGQKISKLANKGRRTQGKIRKNLLFNTMDNFDSKLSIMDTLYGEALTQEKRQYQEQHNIDDELHINYNKSWHQDDTIKTLGNQKQHDNFSIDQNDNSDIKSLLQYRERKKAWNQIIEKRQKIAQQKFKNNIELQKLEQLPGDNEDEDGIEEKIYLSRKNLRKRRKKGKHNKQLQKVYLQRLANMGKKSAKDMFASNKALKYQF